MSVASKGKKKSIQHCLNISLGTKGKPKEWARGEKNINYGGKIINRLDVKEKYLASVKKRGLAWSEEDKKRQSIKMLGESNKMRGKNHSDETKSKLRENRNNLLRNGLVKFGGHKISKPEKEIASHLEKLNIKFKPQYHIEGLPYTYDFFILDTNIIIEFQGDYWHCNPLKYKSGQLVKFQRLGEKLVDDVWKKDSLKKELARSKGFVVIQIWQSDYNKYGIDFIINKMKENGFKTK
jgi:G:T-mismatch repair DNA endonuclease (very short patch repair protein)